jgi:hypothetical protein
MSPASQTTWEHKTPESNKSDGRYPNFLKFSLTLLDEKLGVEHANSQVLYNLIRGFIMKLTRPFRRIPGVSIESWRI